MSSRHNSKKVFLLLDNVSGRFFLWIDLMFSVFFIFRAWTIRVFNVHIDIIYTLS